MTVAELIAALQDLDSVYQDLEVIHRLVLPNANYDSAVESARIDIIGGPTKADERIGIVLR